MPETYLADVAIVVLPIIIATIAVTQPRRTRKHWEDER